MTTGAVISLKKKIKRMEKKLLKLACIREVLNLLMIGALIVAMLCCLASPSVPIACFLSLVAGLVVLFLTDIVLSAKEEETIQAEQETRKKLKQAIEFIDLPLTLR